MKKSWLIIFPLLLASSCIDFTHQTLTYHYDEDVDVLRIFQVYEGVFGSEEQEAITDEEKRQLASVYQHQRTFFFGNWITEYNADAMQTLVSEPFSKDEEADGPPTPRELEAYRQSQTLARVLLDNVQVDNGSFYRNPKGKLSAYQRVTINQVSTVIEASNRMIAQSLLTSEPTPNQSGETRSKLQKAAEENFPFIERAGNQFRFHWPIAPIDFRRMKKGWAQNLATAIATEDAEKVQAELSMIQQLLAEDIWISYVEEQVIVAAGYPTNNQTRIQLDLDKTYTNNLSPYVERMYGIEEDLDLEKIKQSFLLGQ